MAIKDFGKVEIDARASGHGGHKGQAGKDAVDDGEGKSRELHKDDEDGERILHRQGLEDGGHHVEGARVAVHIGILQGINVDLAMAAIDGAARCHVGGARLGGGRLRIVADRGPAGIGGAVIVVGEVDAGL